MTAAYHCVPANRFKNTADINVSVNDSIIVNIDWNMCMEEKEPRERGQERIHIWSRRRNGKG